MATFLLLHGGFCRRWVWDDTLAALAAHGHRVDALDLPSSGADPAVLGDVQDDVETVSRALHTRDGGAVLVGHSGAGATLAELAHHPAVRHSVYLAALRPQRGQSIADMLGGQIPDWMAVHPEDGVVRVSEDAGTVHQALCADVEEDRFLREVYPRYVATSVKSLAYQNSAPDAQHPSTYVICEQDRAVPVAAQEAMAAAGDRVERLPSSHSPLLSMPERLAQVLDRAATEA